MFGKKDYEASASSIENRSVVPDVIGGYYIGSEDEKQQLPIS
jgi:hypothetical protein